MDSEASVAAGVDGWAGQSSAQLERIQLELSTDRAGISTHCSPRAQRYVELSEPHFLALLCKERHRPLALIR